MEVWAYLCARKEEKMKNTMNTRRKAQKKFHTLTLVLEILTLKGKTTLRNEKKPWVFGYKKALMKILAKLLDVPATNFQFARVWLRKMKEDDNEKLKYDLYSAKSHLSPQMTVPVIGTGEE